MRLQYSYMQMIQISKVIRNENDQQKLQSVMNLVKNWSDQWLLKLSINKDKTVSYCLKHIVDTHRD